MEAQIWPIRVSSSCDHTPSNTQKLWCTSQVGSDYMFLVKARSQRVDFALYFLAVACFSTESRRPLQVNAHVFSFDRKKQSHHYPFNGSVCKSRQIASNVFIFSPLNPSRLTDTEARTLPYLLSRKNPPFVIL